MNRKGFRFYYSVLLALTLLLSGISFAHGSEDSTLVPPDISACRPLSMLQNEGNLVVGLQDDGKLNEDQRVYVLYNLSNEQIYLTHKAEFSKGTKVWTSPLCRGRLSALALKGEVKVFQCSVAKPGSNEVVPCKDVVSLCEYTGQHLSPQNQGTYWISQDKTFADLERDLVAREVIAAPITANPTPLPINGITKP